MSELQVLPLVRVYAKYGPAGGKYPERIRVTMADGTAQWYEIEVKQPAPVLKGALDRFGETCMKRAGECYQRSPAGDQKSIYRGHCTTEREEK